MPNRNLSPAYIAGLIAQAEQQAGWDNERIGSGAPDDRQEADETTTQELPVVEAPAPEESLVDDLITRASLRANWARRRWSALWRRETALETTAVLPAVRL